MMKKDRSIIDEIRKTRMNEYTYVIRDASCDGTFVCVLLLIEKKMLWCARYSEILLGSLFLDNDTRIRMENRLVREEEY